MDILLGEIIHLIEKSLKKKIEELDVMELLEHLKMVNVLYQEGELHEEEKSYYSIVIRYLTLNITDTCNLFCRHCYIDASSKNQKSVFELRICEAYNWKIKKNDG